MEYQLISEEEYDNLPDEDDRCFVEFEAICRRSMTRMIDQNTTNDFDTAVREQYISAVYAVAIECHVEGIDRPDVSEDFFRGFSAFSLQVQGAVARIRIRRRGDRHPYSVLLTDSTRTKIEHYISRIRDLVTRSEMDPDRKKRLDEKLDQLVKELSQQRVSFAKAMAILVGVTTVIAGVTTIAADGQSAIAHIMQLIGQDKESEEAAAKRLAPPPKALPSPARSTAMEADARPARRPPAPTYDLDDDIPF